MQSAESSSEGPEGALDQAAPAGLVSRLLAGLVDWTLAVALAYGLYLILYIGLFALKLEGSTPAQQDYRGMALVIYAMTLGPWLYFAGLESSALRGPIGKALVGLRVCDRDGQQVSFKRASARHFAKLLTIGTLGLGLVLILLSAKRQSLHDRIAQTLVMKPDDL